MGYLQFDKNQLINLEYSLNREILRSNRAGSYASTTIIGCNTRKYHGLLAAPVKTASDERYVLLSTLDATISQHGQEFNLGIHKFQGDLYIPRGHKYVRDFQAGKVGETIYRVGGVVLKRESLLVEKQEQILIKFTLLESHSPTTLRLKPFLAYRNIHSLSKANSYVNTKYRNVDNGISTRLYEDMPILYMQCSKAVDYIHHPDWYYNIEYLEEQRRGYDYKEDLFVPGYFEFRIKNGESIIFSASTKQVSSTELKRKYQKELEKRIPRDSFHSCLVNAAEQFIVKKEKATEVIAGFPWFGTWGRDTFISFPGLTLSTGKISLATEIINTMIKRMKGGLFPNTGDSEDTAFNSVDAPLWFIWALQQYEKYTEVNIWERYGKAVKEVLNAYKKGTSFNIHMQESGLIWAGEEGKALTWMDALSSQGPVTPRSGLQVEINALWYNAVMVSLKWAEKNKGEKFMKEWSGLPDKIKSSFLDIFWSEEKGYLADFVDGENKDFAVRPNMVIATSMEYNMLTKEMKNSILEVVKSELLTPKGLRTLSPKNPDYKGIYEGDQDSRDEAYHQGTVWPWLLEHFVKSYLDIHKNTGLILAKKIFLGLEQDMINHGIGSISEIYDGDPPHHPKGAISQAWSVSALLRISEMIDMWDKNKS